LVEAFTLLPAGSWWLPAACH